MVKRRAKQAAPRKPVTHDVHIDDMTIEGARVDRWLRSTTPITIDNLAETIRSEFEEGAVSRHFAAGNFPTRTAQAIIADRASRGLLVQHDNQWNLHKAS